MFGFTSAPCPSCLATGHVVWRSAFCGLSCSLARDFGPPARLLVNRDATLLGLLGIAIDPRETPTREKTCCNPLARPYAIHDSHPAIRHAAAVSMCGLLAKLDDDARDECGWRGWISRLGSRCLDSPAGQAVQWLNSSCFPTAEVVTALDRQARLEAECGEFPETPTATAFSRIFGHLATITGQPSTAASLARIGSSLGSLIYWKDAWDDQQADAKRQRYNALTTLGRPTAAARISAAWQEFSTTLNALPVRRHGDLIKTVLRATQRDHGLFLAMDSDPPEKPLRKRRRKSEDPSSCCEACCSPCDFLECCCRGFTRTGWKTGGCCDCNPCDGDCCCCGN
jgi:hypothetical protein